MAKRGRKKVSGVNKVVRELNKEISKIEGRTLKGLIRAGVIVIRDMEKTSPKVPVDWGNLRASRFMVTSKGATQSGRSPNFKNDSGDMAAQHSQVVEQSKSWAQAIGRPVIILGFSANYAWYVHEAVDKTFKRPGSGAKFLESALDRNRKQILDMIRQEARVKP